MYRDDQQLMPYARDAAQRLVKALQNLSDELQSYRTELQTMMEQNADDFWTRVSTYICKIKKCSDNQDMKR